MAHFSDLYGLSTEFIVENGDFSMLEIRPGTRGFHYFYDTSSSRLITDFILENRQRVATLCQVTLIKKDATYSPRIRLWKKDKTKQGKQPVEHEVKADDVTKIIKATVDTDSCHKNFWRVIDFLRTFSGIELPDNDFRLVHKDTATLVETLRLQDRPTLLEAVRTVLGGSLTEADLLILANRKEQLGVFRQLLDDRPYVDQYKRANGLRGDENAWQHFFEKNQWIFGYGLNLISCESVTDQKLEQITTGANIFAGAGKRSDAVLRSKGYISSLLFAEIKTHETPLLEPTPYRVPDVYRPYKELVGGLAQLQKTAEKAVRGIAQQLTRLYAPDGTPLGLEVSTIKPKQVLIIGQLSQFITNGVINPEKSMTFELHRRELHDVEIITFDELYERARFIVGDSKD